MLLEALTDVTMGALLTLLTVGSYAVESATTGGLDSVVDVRRSGSSSAFVI